MWQDTLVKCKKKTSLTEAVVIDFIILILEEFLHQPKDLQNKHTKIDLKEEKSNLKILRQRNTDFLSVFLYNIGFNLCYLTSTLKSNLTKHGLLKTRQLILTNYCLHCKA